MDNNFDNNNFQPNQTPDPNQEPKRDFSEQFNQFNQPRNNFEPQQPENQPQQPQQPDYGQYQPQQPDYNQYQQPQQDYNQYQQNNPVQPYDYNQNAYQQPVYDYQNGNVNNYGAPTAEGPTGAAKVFSIVSLICGIVSLITCCYSFIPGIPGLIFAIVAKAKYKGKNTMATLGMVFSIIGLVLGIIWAIIFIAMGVLGGTSDLSNYRYY